MDTGNTPIPELRSPGGTDMVLRNAECKVPFGYTKARYVPELEPIGIDKLNGNEYNVPSGLNEIIRVKLSSSVQTIGTSLPKIDSG